MASVCDLCKKPAPEGKILMNVAIQANCGVDAKADVCPKCQDALPGKIEALGFTSAPKKPAAGLGSK